jgi:hypothetical protein
MSTWTQMSVSEVRGDIAALLIRAHRQAGIERLASDGTPAIASMVSVWVLSQIGRDVGRPKLVNLSRVQRRDLRSLGGLAALVHRTLNPSQSAIAGSEAS